MSEDPIQSSQGSQNPDTARSVGRGQGTPENLNDIDEHAIEEFLSLGQSLLQESKGKNKTEKKKEAEAARRGEHHSVKQGERTESANATAGSNKNKAHLNKPPNSPGLKPPSERNAQIPTDETGSSNPWLDGSGFAAILNAMLKLVPIMAQIKISEAQTQADMIQGQIEAAIDSAEAGLKAKEAEADKLQLEAVKNFVNAGIQFGMALAAVGRPMMSSGVKGANPRQAAGRMKTNIANRAKSFKQSQGIGKTLTHNKPPANPKWATGVKPAAGAQRRGSVAAGQQRKGSQKAKDAKDKQNSERNSAKKQKTEEKQRLQEQASKNYAKHQMQHMIFQQTAQGLVSANEGVFGMLSVEHVLEQGKQEFIQKIMSSLAETMGRGIQQAEREIKQASDQLSELVGAMNQVIQAQAAFRAK